jgi:hypothetical protein
MILNTGGTKLPEEPSTLGFVAVFAFIGGCLGAMVWVIYQMMQA